MAGRQGQATPPHPTGHNYPSGKRGLLYICSHARDQRLPALVNPRIDAYMRSHHVWSLVWAIGYSQNSFKTSNRRTYATHLYRIMIEAQNQHLSRVVPCNLVASAAIGPEIEYETSDVDSESAVTGSASKAPVCQNVIDVSADNEIREENAREMMGPLMGLLSPTRVLIRRGSGLVMSQT